MPHNLTSQPSGGVLISGSYTLADLASGVHQESTPTSISGAVSTLDFSNKAVLTFQVVGDLSGSFVMPPLNIPTMPANYTRSALFIEFIQDATGGRAVPLDTLFANATTRSGIAAVNPAANSKTRIRFIIEKGAGPTLYHVEYVPYHTHAFEFEDLTGVDLTTPVADDWLKFDGTDWINAPLPAGQVPEGYAVVNSVTSLRALTPTVGVPVLLTGYAAAGDGGAGVFHWNATDDPQMAASVTIATAGTGYAVGSFPVVNADGNATTARFRLILQVTSVDGSGGVTGIEIVRAGKYYSSLNSNPLPVAGGFGTGLTVNVTWANMDDGGTVLSPAGSDAGRWLRDFSGPVNAKWFGAGINANSQPELMKAISNHRHVYIPEGTYTIYNPLILFDESRLEGAGTHHTSIYGSDNNIGKPLIKTHNRLTLAQMNAAAERKVWIRGLSLQGYCTTAISLVRGTYSYLDQIRIHNLFNTTHAVIAEDCWNTRLSNFTFTAIGNAATSYTPPSDTACLFIGRFANAFIVDHLVTAGDTDYGIYMQCEVGQGSGQWLSKLTLQGHNKAGVYLRNNGTGPTYIDGIFTESCGVSVRIGDKDASQSSRGVFINGGWLATSSVAQNGIAVVYADLVYGLTVTGCTFSVGNTRDNCAFLFNDATYVRISGVYVAFRQHLLSYCRRKTSSARPEIQFVDEHPVSGSNHHSVLIMKASSATNGAMARAHIDGSGVWQTEIVTIPVHSNIT